MLTCSVFCQLYPRKSKALGLFLLFFFFALISDAWSSDFLIFPQQDARFGPSDPVPVFQWQDIQPESTYFFEISLDSQFYQSVILEVDEPQFDMSSWISAEEWKSLQFRAYWRVKTIESVSDPRFFTKTTLQSPRVDLPFDLRLTVDDPAPFISWSRPPGTTSFGLAFSTDASFVDPVVIRWDLSSLDLEQEIPSDIWSHFEGRIFLRVWAIDQNGLEGPFYGIHSISKCNVEIPDIGRPNGDIFTARSVAPVFIWQGVSKATGYCFQIAPGGNFDYESRTYASSSNSVDLSQLLSATEWQSMWGAYRWRICAMGTNGSVTPWSQQAIIYKCGRNVFVALGDSITHGGTCGVPSWVDQFQNHCKARYGDDIKVINEAVGGTKSEWGAWRIEAVVSQWLPEFVMIMFGANDAVDPGNCHPTYDCRVAEHLQEMAYIVQSYGAIPVISSVLPVNPEGERAYAQDRIDFYNDEIYQMAAKEGIQILDLNAVFWMTPDMPSLFCDWGHPSLKGSNLLALEYFNRIIEYE